MPKVYLGLGSNKGERLSFLSSALSGIAQLPRTKVAAISSVYETEPVGKKDQPEFLNAVAEVHTELPPTVLLRELKNLERDLGRLERTRWGPREIDIDILYYDDLVFQDELLRVPHNELANRRFVLIPLNEIAPGLIDPARKLSTLDLLKFCRDTSSVRKTRFVLDPDTETPKE